MRVRFLIIKITKNINRGLASLLLIGLLSAQGSELSEIFFLDLGIVIEPSKGSESYNRVVDKTSKEVSFKIKKVESGSVYMASSNELLGTLDRINDRIKSLELSFHSEINDLRNENQQLRQDLANIQKSNAQSTLVNKDLLKNNQPKKALNALSLEEDKEVIHEHTRFDHSAYMSGVFAYQRENYKVAIKKFASLKLKDAPKKTSENILYWMADAYQQDKQYVKALELLNQITSTDGARIDDALIQKGLLHRKMGNESQALTAFTSVVYDYPKSEYLRLAQLELKKSVSLQ